MDAAGTDSAGGIEPVERAADLRSGIGSVALIVAWRLPGAKIETVEAQEMSVRLARKTMRYNGSSRA